MTSAQARLIGLDWGSSTLRAYLFDGIGTVLAERVEPWGVLSTPDGDFRAAYEASVASWRAAHPELPTIACGMIGSTEGWRNAPYCACPAGLSELAARVVVMETGDVVVHIVPGVAQRGNTPDVMRGEETQIVGALARAPALTSEATLILPGTHAKWVEVRAGKISGFTTYMTGELYALLRDHSILGRPARGAAADGTATCAPEWSAFDRGVALARGSGSRGVTPLLFQCRSLVLTHALRPQESLDFLSGLLIGEEVRAALDPDAGPVALIGEPALCARYARALAAFGVIEAPVVDHAGPAGLWELARAVGLVDGSVALA